MTEAEIIKALDRLEKTKDYLRELYREQVKKCPYPELKPLAKQTYEDNKNAFNIAIKAIEENIRQKAEIEELRADYNYLFETMPHLKSEAYKEFAELVNSRLFKGEKYAYEREYINNLVKELSEVSDNA